MNIVATTSWISIVLILWGLNTKVIDSSFQTWFSFVFFCFMGLASFSWSLRKKQ